MGRTGEKDRERKQERERDEAKESGRYLFFLFLFVFKEAAGLGSHGFKGRKEESQRKKEDKLHRFSPPS